MTGCNIVRVVVELYYSQQGDGGCTIARVVVVVGLIIPRVVVGLNHSQVSGRACPIPKVGVWPPKYYLNLTD